MSQGANETGAAMRAYYNHPVQLSNKEERKLLSSFYRQMGRLPLNMVPLHVKARELTVAQRGQREDELIAFLKFSPCCESILKASAARGKQGKEAFKVGVGIAVCGVVACFASLPLGIGVMVAGGAVCIAGAMITGRHADAVNAWEKARKSAEAQISA